MEAGVGAVAGEPSKVLLSMVLHVSHVMPATRSLLLRESLVSDAHRALPKI